MIRRLIGLGAVLLAGCFFPADRGRVLEGRVDALAAENQKLRAELVENETKLAAANAKLAEALQQLDTSRTSDANLGVKVDAAIQDIAMLRGQVEGYQYKQAEIEGKLIEVGKPPPPTKAEDPKPDEPKRPSEPGPFLELAKETVAKGDLELGRKLLSEFLKKWPRDDRTAEAHLALGEAWYAEKKCPEALYEFGRVIQNYAKSKAAPGAYLRSAECFKEMKMPAEAKLALNELVKSFPSSEQAKIAKQRLTEGPKKGGK